MSVELHGESEVYPKRKAAGDRDAFFLISALSAA
jgi:hypothetical protein